MHRTVHFLQTANRDREIYFGWVATWQRVHRTGPYYANCYGMSSMCAVVPVLACHCFVISTRDFFCWSTGSHPRKRSRTQHARRFAPPDCHVHTGLGLNITVANPRRPGRLSTRLRHTHGFHNGTITYLRANSFNGLQGRLLLGY